MEIQAHIKEKGGNKKKIIQKWIHALLNKYKKWKKSCGNNFKVAG